MLILQSMSAFPRDALLRKAREHLDAARRIAGDAPEVMLGEAEITLATANERWMEALELFERAEAAGLSEDSMPSSKPTALLLGGRVDDAIALLERRVQADSRNPESHQALHVFLRAANEPVRALEVLSRARSFYPPARYEILRGAIFGTYAGDASALRPLAEMTALPDTDSAFLEVVTLPFLRGAHRYADIRKILGRAPIPLPSRQRQHCRRFHGPASGDRRLRTRMGQRSHGRRDERQSAMPAR